MHFNPIEWLFTDPYTAASNAGQTNPESFHFYIPWIIFCSLAILIPFYYSVEGRKRFLKDNPILKRVLDNYLGWFAVIGVVGFPLIFSRAYLGGYFFAWRFWRYLWLIALVFWAVKLVLYLVRKYPKEKASFLAYKNQQQYMPKSGKRRQKAAYR